MVYAKTFLFSILVCQFFSVAHSAVHTNLPESSIRNAPKESPVVQAIQAYAKCIVDNEPVPEEVENLFTGTNDRKRQVSALIARCVQNFIGKNILVQHSPLPSFLKPYFRQVTSEDLSRVLAPLVANGTFPKAALEHVKIQAETTYYLPQGKIFTDAQILATPAIQTLIHSYATLSSARASLIDAAKKASLIAGETERKSLYAKAVPAYVIATEAEIRGGENTKFIDPLFTSNPHAELIIDFGESASTKEGFGNYSILGGATKFIPDSVRYVSVVGPNLTHIGNDFLADCRGLVRVTLPDTITSIGDFFLSRCNRIDLIYISPNVVSIGKYFLFACSLPPQIVVEPGSFADTEISSKYPSLEHLVYHLES